MDRLRFISWIWFLTWLVVLNSAAGRLCPEQHGARSLLQAAGPETDGTIVRTLEVGLVQQECIITFNGYFNPYSAGSFLVQGPESNIQNGADNCCASCHSNDDCNAWQWCPNPEGCNTPTVTLLNGTQVASKSFPYHGCQLMSIVQFSPSSDNIKDIRLRRPDIPFIAGTPFGIQVPKIDGYELELGSDLGGRFNYNCTVVETLQPGACLVGGNSTYIASVCNRDPACLAFSYMPLGILSQNISTPVGYLKTRKDGIISSNFTELNPTSAVYIKLSTLAQPLVNDAVNKQNSKLRVTIAAVVGSVVGIVLIAALVGGFAYLRQYRKMKRSFPDGHIGSDSSDGGTRQGSGDLDVSDAAKVNGRISPPSIVDAAVRQSSGESSPHGNSAQVHHDGAPPNGLVSPFMFLDQETIAAMMAGAPNRAILPGSLSPVELSGPSVSPNASLVIAAGRAAPPSSTGVSDVVVAEILGEGQTRHSSSSGARHLSGLPQGSTARELLDAFSKLYRQRPAIDYTELAAEIEKAPERDPLSCDELEKIDKEASTKENNNKDLPEQPPLGGQVIIGPDDWSIKPEEVDICRRQDNTWWQLGTGAYGTVYRGKLRDNEDVAVKVLHRFEDSRYSSEFRKEITLLKALNYRHVVRFLGACLDGPSAMLVTELMELGDLWRALPLIGSGGARIFCWEKRGHRVMLDVARGLEFLHSKRIVHMDLKSANILLNAQGVAKIADVGMARVLHKSYLSLLSGAMGTFAWSAPEVLANKRCDAKVDVYSFGVVLWEVCTGQAPVRGDMRPLQAPEDCPVEVCDLYLRCTAEDPEVRPTAKEIVAILSALPN